jgi:hypothetical protein
MSIDKTNTSFDALMNVSLMLPYRPICLSCVGIYRTQYSATPRYGVLEFILLILILIKQDTKLPRSCHLKEIATLLAASPSLPNSKKGSL